MNWFDQTDTSRPVITARAHAESVMRSRSWARLPEVHDRLVMFLTAGLRYFSETRRGELKESPLPLPAFLTKPTLYTLEGEPSISIIEQTTAAPIAVDALETAIALGCKRAFFFGICGGLAPELQIGDVVIPAGVVREEGTSHHYMEVGPNATPDPRLLQKLTDYVGKRAELRIFRGKTVSTDAVYRQTLKKELSWQRDGVLAVDMEMSALLAAAAFRNVPAVGIFVVSDVHNLESDAEWEWGGRDYERCKRIAVGAFLDFIQKEST